MMNSQNLAGVADSPAPPSLRLRRFSAVAPRIVMIGASTGGPQAVAEVLANASEWLRLVPIVVVMHLPRDFMPVVAAAVAKSARMPARGALNGEKLLPGTIYFAPGDKHLRVAQANEAVVLVHSDAEPQHSCKPSVDILFRSGARTFGQAALGVVLTGMGRDGLAGAQAIAEAGGQIIVQDAASSAVWGMPGAIAREGLASAILPATAIASAIDGLMVSSQRSLRA